MAECNNICSLIACLSASGYIRVLANETWNEFPRDIRVVQTCTIAEIGWKTMTPCCTLGISAGKLA